MGDLRVQIGLRTERLVHLVQEVVVFIAPLYLHVVAQRLYKRGELGEVLPIEVRGPFFAIINGLFFDLVRNPLCVKVALKSAVVVSR